MRPDRWHGVVLWVLVAVVMVLPGCHFIHAGLHQDLNASVPEGWLNTAIDRLGRHFQRRTKEAAKDPTKKLTAQEVALMKAVLMAQLAAMDARRYRRLDINEMICRMARENHQPRQQDWAVTGAAAWNAQGSGIPQAAIAFFWSAGQRWPIGQANAADWAAIRAGQVLVENATGQAGFVGGAGPGMGTQPMLRR